MVDYSAIAALTQLHNQQFQHAMDLQAPGLQIQRDTANAENNLTGIKAGLLPAESAAAVAQNIANARLTNVNADLAPGLAKASEAASYGSAFQSRQSGVLSGTQAAGERQLNDFSQNPQVRAYLMSRLYTGMTQPPSSLGFGMPSSQ